MIGIKNCNFEDIKSSDLGGVITNTGNNEVMIECVRFNNICSLSTSPICSGVIYKKEGFITMFKVLVTYCWTTLKGNNQGSSVLYSHSTTSNISTCSISYSSYKVSSQTADSPIYFNATYNTKVKQANFSHNNGNNEWGTAFTEIRNNKEFRSEFNNIINGTGQFFIHILYPKEESSFYKCNIFNIINKNLFGVDTKMLTVSECAFFGNSKGTIEKTTFKGCWSDDSRINSPVSTTTRVYIEKANTDCRIRECTNELKFDNKYRIMGLLFISYLLGNPNNHIINISISYTHQVNLNMLNSLHKHKIPKIIRDMTPKIFQYDEHFGIIASSIFSVITFLMIIPNKYIVNSITLLFVLIKLPVKHFENQLL